VHLVVRILLGPVADELEPANDLADGEEANNLGGHNTRREPLCAGQVPDLREVVGGLLGGTAGLVGGTVHQCGRVLKSVQCRL